MLLCNYNKESEETKMTNLLGYRVYKALTDNEGKVVHKTPVARTGNKANALSHARVWANGVLPMLVCEVYADGTEKVICSY